MFFGSDVGNLINGFLPNSFRGQIRNQIELNGADILSNTVVWGSWLANYCHWEGTVTLFNTTGKACHKLLHTACFQSLFVGSDSKIWSVRVSPDNLEPELFAIQAREIIVLNIHKWLYFSMDDCLFCFLTCSGCNSSFDVSLHCTSWYTERFPRSFVWKQPTMLLCSLNTDVPSILAAEKDCMY